MTDITQLIERLRKWSEPSKTHITSEAADALTNLEARLRIAEKRAEDAEGRDDFLMEILHMTPEELKELRELIKERKQS
jgi:phage baseplate assembly protein W